jgi:hypothetical protein
MQKEPMTQEEIEELCLELNKIGVSQQRQDVHVQVVFTFGYKRATSQLTAGGTGSSTYSHKEQQRWRSKQQLLWRPPRILQGMHCAALVSPLAVKFTVH